MQKANIEKRQVWRKSLLTNVRPGFDYYNREKDELENGVTPCFGYNYNNSHDAPIDRLQRLMAKFLTAALVPLMSMAE